MVHKDCSVCYSGHGVIINFHSLGNQSYNADVHLLSFYILC